MKQRLDWISGKDDEGTEERRDEAGMYQHFTQVVSRRLRDVRYVLPHEDEQQFLLRPQRRAA